VVACSRTALMARAMCSWSVAAGLTAPSFLRAVITSIGPLKPLSHKGRRSHRGRADRSRRTRPPASASGRWPLYFPLLAAPRPGRSGHGLADRLARLDEAEQGHVLPPPAARPDLGEPVGLDGGGQPAQRDEVAVPPRLGDG